MKLPSFKEIFTMMFKIMALYVKFAIAAVIWGAVVMLVLWLILQIL